MWRSEKRETEDESMIWYDTTLVWSVRLACWIIMILKRHLVWRQMNCEYEVWGDTVAWTRNGGWRLSHQRHRPTVITIARLMKETVRPLFSLHQSCCSSYIHALDAPLKFVSELQFVFILCFPELSEGVQKTILCSPQNAWL